MHVHLDPIGGVAGDMFAAALLDAFPERAAPLEAALADGGVREVVTVRTEPFDDGVLNGLQLHTAPAPEADGRPHAHEHPHDHGHEHGHEHSAHHPHEHTHGGGHAHEHHPHRRFDGILAWLREGRLAAPVAERAAAIFTVLAEAEAEVHGIEPEDVTFHEVGAWDSIADVVCAAWLIESLGSATTWSCAPLPLGGGRVRTAHGVLPVPAPATALLLRGMPVVHDGVGGERVTPTGAAILRHLDPVFEPAALAGLGGRIARTGHGFGRRRMEGMSNVLRALALDPATPAAMASAAGRGWEEETLGVCSFEVDDQTAEDLAVALDRLREDEGVLDVVQAPVVGKKGRLLAGVRVLARPEARAGVIERCFAETATLGVRWQTVRRAALAREEDTAAVEGEGGRQRVRVKRARRPDGRTSAKAEMADLARGGADRIEREARRREAESS